MKFLQELTEMFEYSSCYRRTYNKVWKAITTFYHRKTLIIIDINVAFVTNSHIGAMSHKLAHLMSNINHNIFLDDFLKCNLSTCIYDAQPWKWFGWLHNIIQCCLNAVSFLQITDNKHPIAHPWGWDMGCLLWVQTLISVLSHDILYHVITTPNCTP